MWIEIFAGPSCCCCCCLSLALPRCLLPARPLFAVRCPAPACPARNVQRVIPWRRVEVIQLSRWTPGHPFSHGILGLVPGRPRCQRWRARKSNAYTSHRRHFYIYGHQRSATLLSGLVCTHTATYPACSQLLPSAAAGGGTVGDGGDKLYTSIHHCYHSLSLQHTHIAPAHESMQLISLSGGRSVYRRVTDWCPSICWLRCALPPAPC